MPDRLKPPFAVHSNEDAYWLEDAAGVRFSYTYFRAEEVVGTGPEKPSRDVARRLTLNLAKLPDSVLTPADQETREALAKFAESIGKPVAEAAGVLLKDALISVGDLPLSAANRGKAAGGKRRR